VLASRLLSADGGVVTPLLEGLRGDDDLGHVVVRLELEHVLGDVGGLIDLPVGREGDKGTVDDQRIGVLVRRSGAEELRGLVRPQLIQRLLAGKVVAGRAFGAGKRLVVGKRRRRESQTSEP